VHSAIKFQVLAIQNIVLESFVTSYSVSDVLSSNEMQKLLGVTEHSCFVFGRFRVKTLARRVFCFSFATNCGIIEPKGNDLTVTQSIKKVRYRVYKFHLTQSLIC
jgi:hypothetical protein